MEAFLMFLQTKTKIRTKMKYIAAKTIRTINGDLILREGDVLKPINVGQHDFYGMDNKNKFWTQEFLDTKPKEFIKADA